MPLEFRDVQYRQGDLHLEIKLSFTDGIIVGLTGPNGAGKSLLLELAAGLIKADIGEVRGPTSWAAAGDSFRSGSPSEVRASIDSALEQDPSLLIVGESFASPTRHTNPKPWRLFTNCGERARSFCWPRTTLHSWNAIATRSWCSTGGE